VKAPGLPVLDRYLIRELVSPFCLGGALFTFFSSSTASTI